MNIDPPPESDTRQPAGPAGHETSELLTRYGFRHAFFNRLGGVSEGAYSSLNFSFAVGDEAGRVTENFRRAAALLDVPPDKLYFLAQVHGHHFVELSGAEHRQTTMYQQGDALFAEPASSPFALCVRVADCVPLLIADRESGAVAAVHSGWRGTVLNIAGNVCERFSRGRGGAAPSLIASIGPHISARAFEISSDVAEQLAPLAPEQTVIRHEYGAKPHADLRLIIRAQLEQAGLAPEDIDDQHGCTLSEPQQYFSFRRDGKLSGRHLAGIVPRS